MTAFAPGAGPPAKRIPTRRMFEFCSDIVSPNSADESNPPLNREYAEAPLAYHKRCEYARIFAPHLCLLCLNLLSRAHWGAILGL